VSVCVCVSSSSTDPFRNTLTHANCTQVSLIARTAYSLCFHVILVSLDGLEALVQLLLLAWILTGIAINYFMCIFLDNSIPDCWYVVYRVHVCLLLVWYVYICLLWTTLHYTGSHPAICTMEACVCFASAHGPCDPTTACRVDAAR
jgi:hypothetical protein